METNNVINNEDKLFNDLPEAKIFQARLYEYLGSTTLVEFLIQIETKYNINDWEKWLYKTLDYLYPLIKEWKLEVKIMNAEYYIDAEWVIQYKSLTEKEYKKDEAEQAIKDIKTQWLNIYNSDINDKLKDRLLDTLWTIYVQFKLPDWFYTY